MTPCEKHWLEKPKDNKKNEALLSLVMSCDSQGRIFVISRSTVQIRVLAPEKSRGYIKRCNPFLVTVRKTVRTAFLRLGNFAPLLEKYSNMRTHKAFPRCRFFFFPSLLPQYATILGMFSQRPF